MAAAATVGLTVMVATSADETPMDARTTLEQWVETRRLISEERREWALGKELLDDRISMVQREIETLRGTIGEREGNIAAADETRNDLVDQNEALKTVSEALKTKVAALEGRTQELLARLPEPLLERVAPLSARLPEDPETTERSLGERFQNVVGILNAVNKFNGQVSVTSEVRTLGDGTTAEVAALYVGLGQAYYATTQGDAAGMGSSASGTWEWAPANEAAADILMAIKVFENEEPAAFVRLPIRIE